MASFSATKEPPPPPPTPPPGRRVAPTPTRMDWSAPVVRRSDGRRRLARRPQRGRQRLSLARLPPWNPPRLRPAPPRPRERAGTLLLVPPPHHHHNCCGVPKPRRTGRSRQHSWRWRRQWLSCRRLLLPLPPPPQLCRHPSCPRLRAAPHSLLLFLLHLFVPSLSPMLRYHHRRPGLRDVRSSCSCCCCFLVWIRSP